MSSVGSGDVFILLVPPGLTVQAPAGNPWRPVVKTVDLTGVGTAAEWGAITGALASQADLAADLALLAPLASPTLTGVPAAPTAALGTNTTQVATTAFVTAADAAAVLNRARIYGAGGLVSSPKVWVGTASIAAAGTWSADVSAAGFASVLSVVATVLRNTATAVLWPAVTVQTISTTTVTGQCWDGRTLVALGDTVDATTDGAPTTTVQLVVYGT